MKPLHRALLVPVLAVLAVLAALAGGCGGSSGSGATDPATFVPAGAPFYAEAVLRPNDAQRRELEAVAGKVLDTDDPARKVVELFDRATKDKGVTYAEDIEPWLGDRIGVAVTSLGASTDAVVVVASKDDDKARKAIAKQKGQIDERSYRGVDYRYDREEKSAAAVFDHALVVGSEPALKAAVDAAKGDALAESKGLRSARDELSDERLGLAYLNVEGFLRSATSGAGANAQAGALLQAVGGGLPRTLAAALEADADALRIDAVSIGTPRSATAGPGGSTALTGLPASAWLGLGLGDLGKTLEGTLSQIASAGGLSGIGVAALLGQLEQQTGLDIRRDVLAWMGDAGVFVSGTAGANLRGGLIVHSNDPEATERALDKLVALARTSSGTRVSRLRSSGVDAGYALRQRGAPPIYVALAGERFVVAVGAKALREATAGGATLGSSPELTAAAAKLGGRVKPSFFLSLAQVTQLLASFAGNDRGFQQAEQYLDAFGALVAGAKDEGGGVTRVRAVVTLR